MLSFVAFPALQCFSTSQKVTVFGNKLTFVWNLYHSKKNSAGNYHKCTSVSLLSDFIESLTSWTEWKILRYQVSWKSFHWEPSCSVRMDGHTDVTKLIVAFRSFVNAPKHHSLRFITSYFWTHIRGWLFDYDHSSHFRFLKHRWTSSKFLSFIYFMYIFISLVRKVWLRVSTATLF